MLCRPIMNGPIRPFPSALVPLFQNECKCETFQMKMSSACSSIFMQIKGIFIWMVSQLVSLWNRGTRVPGNSLLLLLRMLRGKKRWRLSIIPLTITCECNTTHCTWRAIFFNGWNCVNYTVYTRFKDFKTFLYIFTSVVKIFVHHELYQALKYR